MFVRLAFYNVECFSRTIPIARKAMPFPTGPEEIPLEDAYGRQKLIRRMMVSAIREMSSRTAGRDLLNYGLLTIIDSNNLREILRLTSFAQDSIFRLTIYLPTKPFDERTESRQMTHLHKLRAPMLKI